MNALSPADIRKRETWRLINLETGETIICTSHVDWDRCIEALEQDGLANPRRDEIHCAQILTEGHPLEGAEYITVNGEPVAFTSWDWLPTSADEMREALNPIQLLQAAE